MSEIEQTLKPMTQQQIIAEISKDTLVKKDIVAVVLERYTDIAIEQIVNGRGFKMKNVFSINYHQTTKRPGFKGKGAPSQRFITAKISRRVKDLYKLQNLYYEGHLYVINRDTWKGAVKWIWSPEHRSRITRDRSIKNAQDNAKTPLNNINKPSPQKPVKPLTNPAVNDDLYNPLLDDSE